MTSDELDDLVHYLYEPYKALGGNGSGEAMVENVKKLPVITAAEAEYKDLQFAKVTGGEKS